MTIDCEGKSFLYVFLCFPVSLFDMHRCRGWSPKGVPPLKFDKASGMDTFTTAVVTAREFIGVLRMLAGATPVLGPPVQAVVDVTIMIVNKIEVCRQRNAISSADYRIGLAELEKLL